MNIKEIQKTVATVIQAEANGLSSLVDHLDYSAVKRCIEIIMRCKKSNNRVISTGAGTSGAAAKKIAHTLSCIEVPSFYLTPSDSVHGGFGALQKGDVLIAISKGGTTSEIMKMVPIAKRKGAIVIGVTEIADSPLAMQSDLLIKIRVDHEPDPFNMLATASTMAVISVFDAIAIGLMEYTGYSKDQFLIIHPGGEVGRRLSIDTKENQ